MKYEVKDGTNGWKRFGLLAINSASSYSDNYLFHLSMLSPCALIEFGDPVFPMLYTNVGLESGDTSIEFIPTHDIDNLFYNVVKEEFVELVWSIRSQEL